MAKILYYSLACFLFASHLLSELQAQVDMEVIAKKDTAIFEFYYGYAIKENGNDKKTKYYTEIIKVLQDGVSKHDFVQTRWNDCFFNHFGALSNETGIFGPFSNFEDAFIHRQAYLEITNKRVTHDEFQARERKEKEDNEWIIVAFEYKEKPGKDSKKEKKDTKQKK